MKNAVKRLTLLYIFLILLLTLVGSFSGAFAAPLEIAAYALVLFVGCAYSKRLKREREVVAGVAEEGKTLLSPRGMSAYVPLFAPTVALVLLLSWLTSMLLGLLGKTPTAVPTASLAEMLIAHALIPAVLEELGFRYLPMKLLAPYSKRWCVILSAMFFALIHMSLFQIPYAFLAGVIFIMIDLACESVLPSIILHFLNNAVSVLLIKWGANTDFTFWVAVVLVAACVPSLVAAIFCRKRYARDVRAALDSGEGVGDAYSPTVFAVAMLTLAIMNL